jgi:hypothetical protein
MLVAQFGQSANELVAAFGNKAYRYGFPDQYAYGPPVRAMHYDASRIYQGVIGRRYPDAQTMRYHSLYDPNMYQQPGVPAGFGSAAVAVSPQEAIAVLNGLLSLVPAGAYSDYDVVFDTGTAGGAGVDIDNKLWIIHGGTFDQVRYAVAAAGGNTVTMTPDANLAQRITNARELTPEIVMGTLGKLGKVRDTISYMIELLQSGQAQPVAVTPITIATSAGQLATPKQLAIAGATVGVVALGVIGAVLLLR